MTKSWFYVLLTVLFIAAFPAPAGETRRCATCGEKLQNQYYKSQDGKLYFCSERCAQEKLWSHCMCCGKAFEKGLKRNTVYGEFVFCPQCNSVPDCFVCSRKERNMKKFRDGRFLCARCAKTAVTDAADARRIYKSVRASLVKQLGFPNDHPIGLNFAPYKRLNPEKEDNGSELGLYVYKATVYVKEPTQRQKRHNQPGTEYRENERCAITVVDSLPEVKLREVLAHELAHDYMQHRWFYIDDPLLKEGFAETVAAYYNNKTGAENWNVRMEENPDPVYGDGYRLVSSWYKQGGWREVERRLDAENERRKPAKLRTPTSKSNSKKSKKR